MNEALQCPSDCLGLCPKNPRGCVVKLLSILKPVVSFTFYLRAVWQWLCSGCVLAQIRLSPDSCCVFTGKCLMNAVYMHSTQLARIGQCPKNPRLCEGAARAGVRVPLERRETFPPSRERPSPRAGADDGRRGFARIGLSPDSCFVFTGECLMNAAYIHYPSCKNWQRPSHKYHLAQIELTARFVGRI